MSTGWLQDGAVQRQIDASVEDAVQKARGRLPQGEGSASCQRCGAAIPEERRAAMPGVRHCVRCQSELENKG